VKWANKIPFQKSGSGVKCCFCLQRGTTAEMSEIIWLIQQSGRARPREAVAL